MLRHYLVLKSEGVPLFSFTNRLSDPHYQQEINSPQSIVDKPTLFSGLLSSFVSFSKELGGSLQQIKLDNVDLYMYEQPKVIGVLMADPTTDEDETGIYKKAAELITNRFVDVYGDELDNWKGNITKFNGFKQQIQQFSLLEGRVNPDELCKPCVVACCDHLKKIKKVLG